MRLERSFRFAPTNSSHSHIASGSFAHEQLQQSNPPSQPSSMRPLRPLKHSLVQLHARIVASGSGSGVAIANGRRFHRQQQQLQRHQRSQLLVRAFSDAVDPQKWQQQSDVTDEASADSENAPLNGIGRASVVSVNGGSWEIDAESDD